MLQTEGRFRAEIIARAGNVFVLEFSGALDTISMPELEAALDALISSEPQEIVFDISAAEFICGDGFAAMGRCSLVAKRTTVRSKSVFAQRILHILGYDAIDFVATEQQPISIGNIMPIDVRRNERKVS